MTFSVPNAMRYRMGPLATDETDGNNGVFFIKSRPGQPPFKVIASDGGGWEHVSVSLPHRVPTWDEMCAIKHQFWDDTDCVVQFHPPRSDYVNNHSRCLHLWRPVGVEMPRPPSWMVGVKEFGVIV